MRFLVRLEASKVPKDKLLEALRTLARTFGVDLRNPKWTSYGALELDLFSPRKEDFELFMAAVGPLAHVEFSRDLNVPPSFKPESELYDEARDLFDAERYWECHEVLEGVWRTKEGAEKRLLQGIILVCAALVHHQKGEREVALGVLRRSEPMLDYGEPTYGGVDLTGLRSNVRQILSTGVFVNFRV